MNMRNALRAPGGALIKLAAALVAGVGLSTGALAATSADAIWADIDESSIALRGQRVTTPLAYRTVQLDGPAMSAVLGGAPHEALKMAGVELYLPLPDGQFARFAATESPIMAPALAARYPQIRTWRVRGLDDTNLRGRVDVTPAGFHAMLRTEQGTVYIDPYQFMAGAYSGDQYMSYYRRDAARASATPLQCGFESQAASPLSDLSGGELLGEKSPSRMQTGDELRTYRTAIAATGEYTSFHGGTVADGMAAIVTAMNRVTGIYEEELAVRFELVANNDDIVYTNSSTDPYTNSNVSTMLGQNQSNLDSEIGAGNYDVGHVFSTANGGGIAGLGVVCRGNNKARGATGLTQPLGDPFYVDFVAHELGHQYGGNHSFNGTQSNCSGGNRNNSTAYEPGSGSTIMAYAGICGSDNIQNQSDPYFHAISFDEIVNYTQNSSGSTCPAVSATGNAVPVVSAGISGTTLPIETPFELLGGGSDADGDPLMYRWEQFDLGPAGSPSAPSGNAPIFRSFEATPDPIRSFPQKNDILFNTQTFGELLPTYSRSLQFRLTALDGQGGVASATASFAVSDTAGPFVMTEPNASNVIWNVGASVPVTWNVAGTDQFPVSCTTVNIFMSDNAGDSYDHVLAIGTLNDGSEMVTVPDALTQAARVRVQCANNVFFDISNFNFKVEEALNPDFTVGTVQTTLDVCAPATGLVDIQTSGVDGFAEAITLSVEGLPVGTSSIFTINPLFVPGSSNLIILDTANATSGSYDLTISGVGSIGTREDQVTFNLGATPAAAALLAPADGAVDVAEQPVLNWQADAAVTDDYLVEIATDAGMTTVIYSMSESGTSHNVGITLDEATTYYWRVTASSDCGSSQSAVSAFTVASSAVDTDEDGVADSQDNCSAVANPDQRDTDADGFGNLCDPDLDNNNTVNFDDLALLKAAFFQTGDLDADFDGDMTVNFSDLGIMKAFFFGEPGPSGTVSP